MDDAVDVITDGGNCWQMAFLAESLKCEGVDKPWPLFLEKGDPNIELNFNYTKRGTIFEQAKILLAPN